MPQRVEESTGEAVKFPDPSYNQCSTLALLTSEREEYDIALPMKAILHLETDGDSKGKISLLDILVRFACFNRLAQISLYDTYA